MSTSWGRRVAYVCIALVGITVVGTAAYKSAYVPDETSSRYAQDARSPLPVLTAGLDDLQVTTESKTRTTSDTSSATQQPASGNSIQSNQKNPDRLMSLADNWLLSSDLPGVADSIVNVQEHLPVTLPRVQEVLGSQGRGGR